MKRFLLMFVATVILLTSQSVSEDWASVLKGLLAHKGDVNVKLISMNVNGVVSYSELFGLKRISSAVKVPPNSFRGQGRQLFNDRYNGEQQFNVNQADNIQLDLDMNGATVTLQSHNKGQIRFTPLSQGNILHGWSANGQTYYVLHVTKNPPIP